MHSSKTDRGKKKLTTELQGKIFAIAKVHETVTTKSEALSYDEQTETSIKGSKKVEKHWWLFGDVYCLSKTFEHKGSLGVTTSATTANVRKMISERKVLLKKMVVILMEILY